MVKREERIQEFMAAAADHFGTAQPVRAAELYAFAKERKLVYPGKFLRDHCLVRRGVFQLKEENKQPALAAKVLPLPTATRQPVTQPTVRHNLNAESDQAYASVPDADPSYVPFGEHKILENIIATGQFFPIFITGLSGNGKTLMVEQACAKVKRPMVRIQVSPETDEDDLIGGFRLVQGETRFVKGPIIRAMELGALVLIDEADRADPGKIMCLQGVLEGKPYYMKKTGEVVAPADGFNVIVTANTKGRGSDTGLYTAARILDDAWLERFILTIEHPFPTQAVEKRILLKVPQVEAYLATCKQAEKTTFEDFTDRLTTWAKTIRKTFEEEAITDVVSTRRLVHIVRTYLVCGDKLDAVRLCISRYNEDTKTAFLDLYTKVDEVNTVADTVTVSKSAVDPTTGLVHA